MMFRKLFLKRLMLLVILLVSSFVFSGCFFGEDTGEGATWDTYNAHEDIWTYSWNSTIDYGRFIDYDDGIFWMENLTYIWTQDVVGKYVFVLSFNDESMRIGYVTPSYYYPDETGRIILVESDNIDPDDLTYYYNFFFWNLNNKYIASFPTLESITTDRSNEILDICAEEWDADTENMELYVLGEEDSYLVINDFENTDNDSCEIGFLNHVEDEDFKLADTFYAPSGFQPVLMFYCDYDQDDKSDFVILKIYDPEYEEYYYRVYNSGVYSRWHWVYELQHYE